MGNKWSNSIVFYKNKHMKYLFIAFSLVSLWSCEKGNPSKKCFSVKIVAALCSDVVVTIIDPEMQEYGEDNWLNPTDNQRYNNVFMIQNNCENIAAIQASMMNGNAPFNVQFSEPGAPDGCVNCTALLTNRPSKVHAIKACESK
jgi:hypothetical protein